MFSYRGSTLYKLQLSSEKFKRGKNYVIYNSLPGLVSSLFLFSSKTWETDLCVLFDFARGGNSAISKPDGFICVSSVTSENNGPFYHCLPSLMLSRILFPACYSRRALTGCLSTILPRLSLISSPLFRLPPASPPGSCYTRVPPYGVLAHKAERYLLTLKQLMLSYYETTLLTFVACSYVGVKESI